MVWWKYASLCRKWHLSSQRTTHSWSSSSLCQVSISLSLSLSLSIIDIYNYQSSCLIIVKKKLILIFLTEFECEKAEWICTNAKKIHFEVGIHSSHHATGISTSSVHTHSLCFSSFSFILFYCFSFCYFEFFLFTFGSLMFLLLRNEVSF
jgi:hypothetical protein